MGSLSVLWAVFEPMQVEGGWWVRGGGVSGPPEATSTLYMLAFATNHSHPFTGEVTVMSSR